MFALQAQGFPMYVPFGENTRTDLILETPGGLRRIQCKTGRYRNGVVKFATWSSYAHHPHPKILKRDYVGEVDDFAVFCPDLGAVYLIPIEDLPTGGTASLRVDPPRNNQLNGVRFARAYEVARIDVY